MHVTSRDLRDYHHHYTVTGRSPPSSSIQGSSHAHLYLKTKTHTGITAFKTKTRIVYSELALCHSTHLCSQTLHRTENTFGLCVHWVALSPPRIERQWG